MSEEDNNTRTSPFESRFPINIGITGHVTTTGEVIITLNFSIGHTAANQTSLYSQTVNIPNVYEDHRFDQSVDEGLCFKHKTILCMAIKNSLGQIIGVIQLINKFDGLVRFE